MKKIITLSTIAFLSTAVFAATDADMKIEKLEKKLAKLEKKVSKVNALAAKDNIKWDVDYRTSADKITYTAAGTGNEKGNDLLLSHRLWLGMGYAPTDNMLFRGQLAVNKVFGQPGQGAGSYEQFDWISNETLTDETVRLREAYWLYKDSFGDLTVTASVGRRPATNGFLANLREDDAKAKSPMGHVINMEFDGASTSVSTDALLPGMMFKICYGRGVSNATPWGEGMTNYAEEAMALQNNDMIGFIFVPYNDGQYSLVSTAYQGTNMPGINTMGDMDPTNDMMMSFGTMLGGAVSLKVEGIGDGISDFLDETTVFASYAMSVTDPDAGQAMLGSLASETGTSIWAGINIPNMTGGKFGLEYNQGSEYWRPFTYGEDTLAGSKLAARGSAIEAYWNQPLIDNVFSMQVRYTQISYDYTGSGGFFGDNGTPMAMDSMQVAGMTQMGMFVTEKAEDIRVSFRYRY